MIAGAVDRESVSERRLRDLLSADLSADQRAAIMAALYGPVEGRRRNPHVLNPYEAAVLDAYWLTDSAGKRARTARRS